MNRYGHMIGDDNNRGEQNQPTSLWSISTSEIGTALLCVFEMNRQTVLQNTYFYRNNYSNAVRITKNRHCLALDCSSDTHNYALWSRQIVKVMAKHNRVIMQHYSKL